MVFEHLVDNKKVLKHPVFIPFLTFGYTLLAFGISLLFFPDSASLALIFTITLMLTPSLMHIMRITEKVESRAGISHFLRTHTLAFEVYGLAFLGMFVGLVVVSFLLPEGLSYQMNILESSGATDISFESYLSPRFSQIDAVLSVFTYNAFVVLSCVVLSFFYGAGAVFLVVLNASMFASFVTWLFKTTARFEAALAIFIHLVPEIIGFLLAAIAGATLSWAFMDNRFGTKSFQNVVKNALLMLCVSLGFIFCGAILEVYLTVPILLGIL